MTSMIKGYVSEEDSRGPLEGVWVSSYGMEGGNDSTTDASGYYEFWIFQGDFHFMTEYPGYYEYHEDISVGFEETIWRNISLREAPPETSLIRGYVTGNDTRGPIEGASVDVNMNDYHKHNETDGTGYYELQVPAGYFEFNVHMEGYRHHYQELDVGENETLWVNVTLEPKPPETAFLRGYISSEDSRGPIENAAVGIWGDGDGNQTFTDQDGYYEMFASPGEYIFYVHAEGYGEYYEQMNIGDFEDIWRNISLMMENAMIMGYIMDDSRAPLEDARIELDNHDAGMHYTAWTDETGYYERSLVSGDWYVEVNMDGYFQYREEITIHDYEEYWFNATLEPATIVHVWGTVTENGTGDPIADEEVNFWADEFEEQSFTDDMGNYEVWIAADLWYEVHMRVDGYQRVEEDVYVSGDMQYNILLEPVPPTDVLVRGYVESYEARGPIEAMVGTMSMLFDTDNGTMSDESGYYELGAWSGLGIIMGMAEDHYSYFMVINFTGPEMWYNITLYPVVESESMVSGWITDPEGEPVEEASVVFANYMTGIPIGDDGEGTPYLTITDDEGYYEMMVPNGDWYLIVNTQDDQGSGAVEEVTVSADSTFNVTLPEIPSDSEMMVEFMDWDTIEFANRMAFGMDSSTFVTRIQIDFLMGNRDGMVDEDEAELFNDFLFSMQGDEGDEFDEENTTDNFSVDDIIYDFLLDGFIQELTDIEGTVTSRDPVHMQMIGYLESQSDIPEAFEHTIKVNMSYDQKEGNAETLTVTLPAGFIFESIEASDNISVEGLGARTFILAYIGEPMEDEWEWVTIVSMVPNILPTVDAGEDQEVVVNTLVEFEANAADTDGTIVTYEWDFDTDGAFSADHTSTTADANFTYTTPGNYTVTVRVTDDRGGIRTDTLTMTVLPEYIPVPNLQIDSLDLSDLDPEVDDVVEITVTLKNTGDADALGIKVRVFIDDVLKDLLDVPDIAPNATITVSYNWTVDEGKHTIRINMTYTGGGDETERSITIKGESEGFIPGFELMIVVIAFAAVALFVSWRRKY